MWEKWKGEEFSFKIPQALQLKHADTFSVLPSQASVQSLLSRNLNFHTWFIDSLCLLLYQKVPVFLCTGGQGRERGSRIDGSFRTVCDWKNEEWKVAKVQEFNTCFISPLIWKQKVTSTQSKNLIQTSNYITIIQYYTARTYKIAYQG